MRTRIEEGGEGGRQAAIEVILQVGDWRGLLRSLTGRSGALGEGVGQRLEEVRRDIVREVMRAVESEAIVARDVGSRGFTSDIDVTFNPRDPSSLIDPATADSPNPVADPARVAAAVEASGEAARAFMARLRERLGGQEPERVLDTNAYTYTGAEAPLPIPGEQAVSAAHVMDVVGLVEIRRGLQEANPAEAERTWNDFREQAIRQATPEPAPGGEVGAQQAALQAEVRARIELQFRDAEVMAERVAALEDEIRQQLSQGERPLEGVALTAHVSEEAAARLRRELVEALRQDPIDYSRVRQLQGQIKLVEPESYATRAAVADVVEHQQVLTGAERPVSPGETARHWETGEETPQGARVTDPRLLAQSAASSLGLLQAHLHGGLMGQLKSIAKYCYRIDHAREGAGARPDTPEIRDNFTHQRLYGASDLGPDDILRRMVGQWARRHGMGDMDFDVQAQAYIDFRRRWAQEAVIGLRILAETREAAFGAPMPESITAHWGTPAAPEGTTRPPGEATAPEAEGATTVPEGTTRPPGETTAPEAEGATTVPEGTTRPPGEATAPEAEGATTVPEGTTGLPRATPEAEGEGAGGRADAETVREAIEDLQEILPPFSMPPDRRDNSPRERARYERDAQTMFEDTCRRAPSRMAALYWNEETGQYVVIQGDRHSLPTNDTERWREILDRRDVGHWEPVDIYRPSSPEARRPAESARGPDVRSRETMEDVPSHLAESQRTVRRIFDELGGPRHFKIAVCDDATSYDSPEAAYPNLGTRTREMGAHTDIMDSRTIWVHEEVVQSDRFERKSSGRILNLRQVIAHEIGHANLEPQDRDASRYGADLLDGDDRAGLLNDAVELAIRDGIPLAELNLPPDFTPTVLIRIEED